MWFERLSSTHLGTLASQERARLEGELEDQRVRLEAELEQERGRLEALQGSLERGENPQLLAMRQRLQAQHEAQLRTARSTMATEVKELNALLLQQSEARLHDAHTRLVLELSIITITLRLAYMTVMPGQYHSPVSIMINT